MSDELGTCEKDPHYHHQRTVLCVNWKPLDGSGASVPQPAKTIGEFLRHDSDSCPCKVCVQFRADYPPREDGVGASVSPERQDADCPSCEGTRVEMTAPAGAGHEDDLAEYAPCSTCKGTGKMKDGADHPVTPERRDREKLASSLEAAARSFYGEQYGDTPLELEMITFASRFAACQLTGYETEETRCAATQALQRIIDMEPFAYRYSPSDYRQFVDKIAREGMVEHALKGRKP